MKTFIVLALCLGVALCSEWESYKREHGKVYKNPTEDKFRQLIYKDRVAKINAHNALFEENKVTYKQGINRFTDMTALEVKEMMNGLDMSLKDKPVKIPKRPYKSSGVAAPSSMDWRQYNYVTGVKDQGQCGSCWSFSTTGAIEGQWAKTQGQLISLSEQQLVDCSTANYGCDGGWPSVAYEYVWGPTGSEHEENYPYEAIDDTCRYNSAYVAATISAYVEIPQYNEGSLLDAAGSVGPISVCIDASHDSFQSYSSGVYYEPACDQNNLDHAVLVAGYGNENGEDYWLVKNSWGTGWGEEGYIKMARNQGNNCGIASAATYPIAP